MGRPLTENQVLHERPEEAGRLATAGDGTVTSVRGSVPEGESAGDQASLHARACPCCGSRMVIIEVFERGSQPKHRPTPVLRRIDTS